MQKGAYVKGIKTVSFEECFLESPGQKGFFPRLLIFEAVAQLASWLICYTTDFKYKPILLKVDKAELFGDVRCGTSLLLEVELAALKEDSAVINGLVKVENEIIARGVHCLCQNVLLDTLENPDAVKGQFKELSEGALLFP